MFLTSVKCPFGCLGQATDWCPRMESSSTLHFPPKLGPLTLGNKKAKYLGLSPFFQALEEVSSHPPWAACTSLFLCSLSSLAQILVGDAEVCHSLCCPWTVLLHVHSILSILLKLLQGSQQLLLSDGLTGQLPLWSGLQSLRDLRLYPRYLHLSFCLGVFLGQQLCTDISVFFHWHLCLNMKVRGTRRLDEEEVAGTGDLGWAPRTQLWVDQVAD